MAIDGAVTIRPLGGLGEIGMNCLAISEQGITIAVDCGAMFSNRDDGVERWIPPVEQLVCGPFGGLVLTHGHEDHIGAVPELATAVLAAGQGPLKIWGPPYALGLVELRLAEASLRSADVCLLPVEPGVGFQVGPFRIEALRMTHSIADATALSIETRAGRVVHSGDFKLDPSPLVGPPSDEVGLQAWGDAGVRLLLSDSTNALREGHSASEKTVAEALGAMIQDQPGRVVVGIFSSNVHRLKALGQIAQASGRKICLLGRSMRKHVELANRLGYLNWPSDCQLRPFAAKQQAPNRVLYLATGTQGEERGALSRLAAGTVKDVQLDAGDTVLISSRIIPGCEDKVYAMYNAFLKRGLRLINQQSHPQLHASGHAYREEQRSLLRWLRPEIFVPLHGTTMHLQRHAALAKGEGVADVQILHNGQSLVLSEAGVRRLQDQPAHPIAMGPRQALSPEVLQQRGQLGQSGMVVVALQTADRTDETVCWDARIVGVAQEERVQQVIRGVIQGAGKDAAEATRSQSAGELLARTLKSRIAKELGERPSVYVLSANSKS